MSSGPESVKTSSLISCSVGKSRYFWRHRFQAVTFLRTNHSLSPKRRYLRFISWFASYRRMRFKVFKFPSFLIQSVHVCLTTFESKQRSNWFQTSWNIVIPRRDTDPSQSGSLKCLKNRTISQEHLRISESSGCLKTEFSALFNESDSGKICSYPNRSAHEWTYVRTHTHIMWSSS